MRHASLFFLFLASCASSGSNSTGGGKALPSSIETEQYVNMSARISADGEPSIGQFLSDVSNRVQAWSNARYQGNEEQVRLLEGVLKFNCLQRQAELIHQLETGPPRNRSLAAVALGFTNSHVIIDPDKSLDLIDRGALAVSPLLFATMDDDAEVAANALMGLGILGRIETPLEPICNALDTSPNTSVRSNASYALIGILGASKNVRTDFSESQQTIVRESCQRGLTDTDMSVRTQSAAALGLVGNADSIPHLGDRLRDEVSIVAQSATTALARLGRDNASFKGRVARLLSGSLDRVLPTRRETILVGLIMLAEANLGKETVEWVDWAARLPR
jgi:HEAT repeat protein